MGPPPPPAVPLPPSPPPAMQAPRPFSASTVATRFATHWVADTLAGDESLDFYVLQGLVRGHCSPGPPLAGAPEATRQRVALRSQQELAAAGGGSAATTTTGVLRVRDAPSPRDDVFRFLTEVESSGILEKDLFPPFSQDIQETICTQKLALPETSLQLLKGVDPWITSMTSQSQLERNDQSLHNSHKCSDIEKPVFPVDSAEVQHENMANLVNERETGNLHKDPSAPTCVLHRPCMPESISYIPPQEGSVDAVCFGARSPERSPVVEENMSVGSVLASAGCDAPLQGSITKPFSQQDKHDHTATVLPRSCIQKSPNLPHCANGEGADGGGSSNQPSKVSSHEGPGAHAIVTPGFDRISDVVPTDSSEPGHLPGSQPDSRKAHLNALQHKGGEKVNQYLEDLSASISPVEKDHVHGDLTLQSARVSLTISRNAANQESKPETNLQPGTAAEDRMAFEDQNADTSHLEVSGANKANQALHEEKSEDTSPEICVRSKYQDIDDILEDLSQQGLCIKCGKDGRLLRCSGCIIAAHDSCFGSSVTFEGTDLFYCPVCFHKKATEAYRKARKNLVDFLGTALVSKQLDELLNGLQPGAANRDGQSNGCAYDLAHRDEEPHQQRKKQKINARGNGYPEEVLTQKVPFQNSGPASMNKHSVLQNNSETPAKDPEKKQQAGDKEARREAGNDNPSHEAIAPSQRRHDPTLDQDNEADQVDSPTASNKSGGKRSSPPWCNMRHNKRRLQEEEAAVPSKYREGIAKQDKHMPTSRRKRKSVRWQKRYSNPVVPPGRRSKLAWTDEEEAFLREAMEIFTPKEGAQIPWTRILEHGDGVFNSKRLPDDLRLKWRSLQEKEQAHLQEKEQAGY